MSGVDISDQYMALLNKKFGRKKMNKHDFIEHVAHHLLDTGLETDGTPKKKLSKISKLQF